jgi:hypothetical protein
MSAARTDGQLTIVAYQAAPIKTAYLEPIAVSSLVPIAERVLQMGSRVRLHHQGDRSCEYAVVQGHPPIVAAQLAERGMRLD